MEEEVKDEEIKEETEAVETVETVEAVESQEEEKTEETVEEKPLDKMTAPELREVAKQIPGVTGVSAMKKADLLSIIKEHRGIKDEEPAKKTTKKSGKAPLSPKELKLKIVQLREEKEKARDAKDKVKLEILRRRINRIKKKTRKAAQA